MISTYTLVCHGSLGCHGGLEGTLLIVERIGVAECAHDGSWWMMELIS